MQCFPEKCQLTFLAPPDASLLGGGGAVCVEPAAEGISALFLGKTYISFSILPPFSKFF